MWQLRIGHFAGSSALHTLPSAFVADRNNYCPLISSSRSFVRQLVRECLIFFVYIYLSLSPAWCFKAVKCVCLLVWWNLPSLSCHIGSHWEMTCRRLLSRSWLNDTPFDSHILARWSMSPSAFLSFSLSLYFPISLYDVGHHPRALAGFPPSTLMSVQFSPNRAWTLITGYTYTHRLLYIAL